MAIRVQLDRVLVERRMSLTELADRVGVMPGVMLGAVKGFVAGRIPAADLD